MKYQLYLAKSKCDGSAIALVEARDGEEAAVRVAYVVGKLGLGDWQEVEIQPAQGYASRRYMRTGHWPIKRPKYMMKARVPTFLDGFFRASRMQGTTH